MAANAKQGTYLGTTLIGFTAFVAGLHGGGGFGRGVCHCRCGLAAAVRGRLLQKSKPYRSTKRGNLMKLIGVALAVFGWLLPVVGLGADVVNGGQAGYLHQWGSGSRSPPFSGC